jgi:hypothetical protein
MYDAEKDPKYSLLTSGSAHLDMSNAGECLLVAILGYLRAFLQVEAESPNEKTKTTTKKQTEK